MQLPPLKVTPATESQLRYVKAMLRDGRVVPDPIRREAWAAIERGLTHTDCQTLIPILQNCPEDGDYIDDYGYDDSPDMGVHRFDGGLGDGSSL
jgi:hypothetical protein